MVKASVIIPTYIERCSKRIAKVMGGLGEPFEIVISEDESTDLNSLRDTSLSRLYITRREG